MPSVVRFLITLMILGAAVYGAAFALVTYVEPQSREITETVPRDQLRVFRDQ